MRTRVRRKAYSIGVGEAKRKRGPGQERGVGEREGVKDI